MSIKKSLNLILAISMIMALLPVYSPASNAADYDVSDLMNSFYGSAIEGDISKKDKEKIIKEKLDDRKISAVNVKKASKMVVQARDNYDPTTILFMKDNKLNSFRVDSSKDSSVLDFDESDLLKHELALISLMEAGVDPQLNYIYKTTAWTVDGDGGVRPDDFDWNTGAPEDGDHWYYEASNVRQMWAAQDCDTAGASCGGEDTVIVAVIDTGLAFEDRDIGDPVCSPASREFGKMDDMFGASNINLYTNSGEVPNDCIDNDNNGSIDDYNGFNAQAFAEDCSIPGPIPVPCESDNPEVGHPNDDQGHGTFVTGMITSLVDNTSGSVSPAHNIAIMPIKANEPNDGTFTTDSLWWALDYAQNNGADVINLSLAGFAHDSVFESKLAAVASADILIIAAMGNFNTGIPMYPAAYSSTIAVGAATLASGTGTPTRASYSNYGNHIDLAAYVGDTASGRTTYQRSYTCFFEPNGCDADHSMAVFTTGGAFGTSFAAPQVAAAAAILIGSNPGITPEEVGVGLVSTANDISTAGFDIYSGHGALDFEAVNNFDPVTLKNYYFTWNDTSAPTRNVWTLVGNPSSSASTIVNIKVGDNLANEYYQINPLTAITPYYNAIVGGPVEIKAEGDVYATQRVLFNGSFNEFPAIEETELTNIYYYTWYDSRPGAKQAWVLVGNPSSTTSANVNITIGDGSVIDEDYVIPPKGMITPQYLGITGGPVVVTSDINVFTTQRSLFDGFFNEFAGIPADSLDTKYYFTWYDNRDSSKQAWMLVGNPSTTLSANVNITIGDGSVVDEDYVIPPGGRVTPQYDGFIGGPVIVTSDIDVFASQRALFNGSFNEYAGISEASLGTDYYFTWYDNRDSNMQAWMLVGNPSTTLSANVNITIGDGSVVDEDYVIPPGGRITPQYESFIGGPIIVTSDIDVFASQRALFNASFNEYTGITVP